MKLRPYSVAMLAFGGAVLMLLGLYFIFVRPPLLPEDPRAMGTTLAQVEAAVPGLAGWLCRVFWVMGSFIFATGLLTVHVAVTSFRARVAGVAGVMPWQGWPPSG